MNRHARGTRALIGFAGGSRLARPPQVLEDPDIKPDEETGRFPNPVEDDTPVNFTASTSEVVSIGRTDLTPANYWNIVLVISDVAPDIPSGWFLSMTSEPTPLSLVPDGPWRVYALERAADTTTSLTVTFPSAARGSIGSMFIDDTTVLARGASGGLGGVTSVGPLDFDPSTETPSTFLVGMVYWSTGGTPATDPSWRQLRAFSAPSRNARCSMWQYEGDPPSTSWVEHTGGIVTTQEFYAYLWWELATP